MPPNRPAGAVEIVEDTPVYQGHARVSRCRLRHLRHGGGWTDVMTREVVERGHAVAVLPYDPVRDEVVLLEQFRIGAWRAGVEPWQIEIVAGLIDEGETPEEVARREADEEAGCAITTLHHVCDFLSSPGLLSETLAIYCGRVDTDGAGGIFGLDHEHEDIRVIAAPAAEVFRWLDQGRIINATALVGLQWFRANHVDLRSRWRKSPES